MSKSELNILSKRFGKPVEFVEEMVKKHNVSLPIRPYRTADDGLDAFYSDMTAYYNTEPSLTKQEFADQSDPNFIFDRHKRGMDISPFFNQRAPRYIDLTDLPSDYHSALNAVTKANQAFNSLDPRVRAHFDNDPRAFVDFVSNPENADVLVEMGLAQPQAPVSSPAATAPDKLPQGGGEGA